jgi:hypothetical protein
MLTCDRCHYETEWRGNFKTHLTRKYPCPSKYSNIPRKDILLRYEFITSNTEEHDINTLEHCALNNMFKCKYCPQTFKHMSSRGRHEKYRCSVKNQIIEKKQCMDNLTNKLLPQIKNILEENNIGTIDLSNHELNLNVNNVNQQQINNIDNSKKVNINNYGEEDLSHITDQQFKEMLEDPFSAMSRLINAIHFNDSKPENQNLCIPNIKYPFIEIFKDGEWVISNQYKLLCKIYTIKKEILHNAFLRIEHQLDEKTKKLYYEFRRVSEGDLFTVQSQLTDIKAAIISGTRHKAPVPSRHALRQTCFNKCNKKLLNDIK